MVEGEQENPQDIVDVNPAHPLLAGGRPKRVAAIADRGRASGKPLEDWRHHGQGAFSLGQDDAGPDRRQANPQRFNLMSDFLVFS